MIYFDYASTSIKRKHIIKEIICDIDKYDGNSSSTHSLGRSSKKYLEEARSVIAKEIGAKSEEIIFTSGATESNNLIFRSLASNTSHFVVPKIEHKSILAFSENTDFEISLVDCEKDGRVNIGKIVESIKENTNLVTLMLVNNETGVIQEVERLGEILKDRKIWFHIDAVQALGHLEIDVEKLNCDSMSFSGHKMGALNGVGMLYIRKKIKPLIIGGPQEFGIRAGTTNVLGALSASRALIELKKEKEYIKQLKDYFVENLSQIDYEINGDYSLTVDHIVNIYFPYLKADFLITYLDMNGILVSSGSACNSGSLINSFVIENMYNSERASKSIRFSFGFTNTKQDIDKLVDLLKKLNDKKKV